MKIKIIHILSNILFAKLQNYFLQPWWKIANVANVTLKTNVALLNILLKIFLCVCLCFSWELKYYIEQKSMDIISCLLFYWKHRGSCLLIDWLCYFLFLFFSLWWLYVCDLQSSLCCWHTEVCRQACKSFSKLVIDVGGHYTLNVSISRLMIHRFYKKQGEQSIDNKPVSKSNPVSTSASAPAS